MHHSHALYHTLQLGSMRQAACACQLVMNFIASTGMGARSLGTGCQPLDETAMTYCVSVSSFGRQSLLIFSAAQTCLPLVELPRTAFSRLSCRRCDSACSPSYLVFFALSAEKPCSFPEAVSHEQKGREFEKMQARKSSLPVLAPSPRLQEATAVALAGNLSPGLKLMWALKLLYVCAQIRIYIRTYVQKRMNACPTTCFQSREHISANQHIHMHM